ncbi:hypothetical protein HPB50_018963 [Hyalomma asiaticum]|uniref:Uncharacterized protein n=1 Tax=Hyalomma asiaticum TaxID=266040 RepID=A0ACB7RQM7_HYAAI|nr:hypothetical protein HPB50_018963 [Hyalomma asiaticum]
MEDGMLDLMCFEAPPIAGQAPRASHDSAIVGDEAVMARLLGLQDRYAVTCDYCRRVQTEVTTPMRKTLALWMSEVCEEQCCEDSVFPTAMNLLDRYLSQVSVRKLHLQLLGCVCLLLASKLRQTRALAVEALVYYTDCFRLRTGDTGPCEGRNAGPGEQESGATGPLFERDFKESKAEGSECLEKQRNNVTANSGLTKRERIKVRPPRRPPSGASKVTGFNKLRFQKASTGRSSDVRIMDEFRLFGTFAPAARR